MSKIRENRLLYEYNRSIKDPIPGIQIFADEEKWSAIIEGPKETPYEGGKFRLNIEFPKNYPFRPPKVSFVNRIFHPNISPRGGICLDILRDQWTASLTVQKLLLSILSLITSPNFNDPLLPEIAALYRENPQQYQNIARKWTRDYASLTKISNDDKGQI